MVSDRNTGIVRLSLASFLEQEVEEFDVPGS